MILEVFGFNIKDIHLSLTTGRWSEYHSSLFKAHKNSQTLLTDRRLLHESLTNLSRPSCISQAAHHVSSPIDRPHSEELGLYARSDQP